MSIYPFLFAVIENPSGGQRTLSVRWTGRTSYNGTAQPYGPDGGAVKIWVLVRASGLVETPMNALRTFQVQGTLHNELAVQIE